MAGPYMGVAELQNSATGIDWTLVPHVSATPQQQQTEAGRIVRRASAWINQYCGQVLWATQDQEIVSLPGRRAVYQNGALEVFPSASPIRSVTLVEQSSDGQTWQSLPGTTILNTGPARIPRQFTYVLGNLSGRALPTAPELWRQFLRLTYVNGYPNAVLTQASAQNATSVVIDDPTGFAPGDVVTLYDDVDTEQATVSPSYVAGSTTLTLAAPLQYAHAAGVTCSEMDEAIRTALILIVTDIVRNDYVALIASQRTGPVQGALSQKLQEAQQLLNPFRRIL